MGRLRFFGQEEVDISFAPSAEVRRGAWCRGGRARRRVSIRWGAGPRGLGQTARVGRFLRLFQAASNRRRQTGQFPSPRAATRRQSRTELRVISRSRLLRSKNYSNFSTQRNDWRSCSATFPGRSVHDNFVSTQGTTRSLWALETLLRYRSGTVRQGKKARTKITHHVLMELAIGELNATLAAGTDDIFQCARRPQAADRVRGARARVLRIAHHFGRCRAKPSSFLRLKSERRNALLEVWGRKS